MIKTKVPEEKNVHDIPVLTSSGMNPETFLFTKKMDWNRLLLGDVDFEFAMLKNLPTQLPENVVIASLSIRDNPADCLLLPNQSVDNHKFMKIPAGGRVAVTTEIQKLQFAEFRSDVHFVLTDGDDTRSTFQKLQRGEFEAAIVPAHEPNLLRLDLVDCFVLELNPQEFVPAVGQGVLAQLTLADNLPTRRKLKIEHHPEVAACTNVERKILKFLGDEAEVAVFCQRDPMGNFHVFAARKIGDSLRRARVSQTTSIGLAERVLSQI